MARYQFLTDEWLVEARKIRATYHDRAANLPVSVRMNQVVKDVPFGEGVIRAHVDTSSGYLEIELGHLEEPDLTITVSYDTAKAILVDGDAQVAMQAFLGGRIKVDGDITKMLAFQSSLAGDDTDASAFEVGQRLQEITL